jgi:hypothetical protein
MNLNNYLMLQNCCDAYGPQCQFGVIATTLPAIEDELRHRKIVISHKFQIGYG